MPNRTHGWLLGLPLFLLACGGGGRYGDGGRAPEPAQFLYEPLAANGAAPYPDDALSPIGSDPTLNLPNASNDARRTAVNLLDGYSTVAALQADFSGELDEARLNDGVVLLQDGTQALEPGEEIEVQISAASGPAGQRRLLISPLRPLQAETRYVVGLTTQLRGADRSPALPATLFKVLRRDMPVTRDADPALANFSDEQIAALEQRRVQHVRPAVEALMDTGLAENELVLAWAFTTQSVDKSLKVAAQSLTAQALPLRARGQRSEQFLPGVASGADLYEGRLTLPYFQADTSSNAAAPLTSAWLADANAPDASANFRGQSCSVFSPSLSVTACFPRPQARNPQTVAVLMTLPNADSGQTMPAAGWPVAIFQHGQGGNRSALLLIGPTLARAGIASVAMDLPLHGISAEDGARALRLSGVGERTFEMDFINNSTGATGADGLADPSGTHFNSAFTLLTSRDNIRQAALDLITLSRSLPGAQLQDVAGAASTQRLDGTRVSYIGHSLGAAVGTVFLGVSRDVGTGVLAKPGGGIGKQLDATKGRGSSTATRLAAEGKPEGSFAYEDAVRDVQTVFDPADPINFAFAARENRPLLALQVIADDVVPGDALANGGNAIRDRVIDSGLLSGTDALLRIMGLDLIAPLAVPIAPRPERTGTNLNLATRFLNGNHVSVIDPSGGAVNAAVTCEMQRQIAEFIASNGTRLNVGGACP